VVPWRAAAADGCPETPRSAAPLLAPVFWAPGPAEDEKSAIETPTAAMPAQTAIVSNLKRVERLCFAFTIYGRMTGVWGLLATRCRF
jgi:hypothetical protein